MLRVGLFPEINVPRMGIVLKLTLLVIIIFHHFCYPVIINHVSSNTTNIYLKFERPQSHQTYFYFLLQLNLS